MIKWMAVVMSACRGSLVTDVDLSADCRSITWLRASA
jgi:hypothetical protein